MNELQTNAQSRVDRPASYGGAAKILANMDAEAILQNAPPKLLEAVAKAVMARRLTDRLDAAAKLAGIDYFTEKETFLNNAGRTQSRHTRRTYANALGKLEAYATRAKIKTLELTPAQADNFIYEQKAGGASAATVRATVAAASSFFAFLERRRVGAVANPFRGTKARPSKRSTRRMDIPTTEEVKIILESLPPKQSAAVAVMAGRGLRCGALPELSVKGDRFSTYTKGKTFKGSLSADVLEAVKRAGLELRKPFADTTANALERNVGYHVGKLRKAGKINAAYSCHDFRHFFAVTEYRKDKDLRRVCKLLGHSGISITETYLQGLGEVE
jgi:site-specific recombinase XerD